MKDVSFHEIIITKNDQKIVSADAEVYDMLGSQAVKPMNELIAIEDMDIYLNNIKNCDGSWCPSKILGQDMMYYTYMRAADIGDLIRFTVVDAKDLLNAHSSLMKAINTSNAHLYMYEDVFFEYDPASGRVNVYNTELAFFETGMYSLDEFEAVLLKRAFDDQKQAVKGFITQVKSGVGRSSTVVEGNLLNDDPNVTHTVLNEAFVFYDKETEGVVGNIQLQSNSAALRTSTIKRDSLTGLVDKTDIIRMARERIDDKRLEGTSLVIIDVDYFKSINDTYGHQFGDEVIKKVADIISNEVGNNGISGRFGGDEFFVLLYNIDSEEKLRHILRGIKSRVGSTFPDKGMDKDNPISVSIGTAVFPKDADNYEDLFMVADHCLYLAKEKGRNRYVIYCQAKHGTIDTIRFTHQSGNKINDRDISCGDVIVKMFDMVFHGGSRTPDYFIKEFAQTFGLQNVHLYVGEPFQYRYSAGSDVINDRAAVDIVEEVLNSDAKDKFFTLGDFVLVNNLDTLPPHFYAIKSFLIKREVYSLVILRFYDKDGRECILIISSVGKVTEWNRSHFKYYRVFTDLLSLLSLL